MNILKLILKVIKSIIGFVVDVCFVILFVYGVTFIPYLIGYKAMTVTSSDDNYSKGTLIYYKSVDLEELRVSDNFLVKNGNEYKVYTISDIKDDVIYTEGEQLKFDDIVGRIAPVSVPYLGYYVQFLNAHDKFVYLLVGLIIVDIILSGIKIRPKKRLQ